MADTKTESKNPVEKLLAKIDAFQQKRRWFAFAYGVIKKYGDDEAGYQGALITYYGFLSLFPLLLVATSVIDIVSRHNVELRTRLTDSLGQYLPTLGDSLQAQIHGSNKTGIALVVGLLITLYGAKGVADAVRHALDHIWQVPRPKRAGFPKGILKSLGLITGVGVGLVLSAIVSGYATGGDLPTALRFLLTLVSIGILFASFCFVFRFGTSSKHQLHDNFPGAIVAAAGLAILQVLGGYLISHQMHNLGGLYGQFAFVLVLLFWIALQAQVFMYAAEINTVRTLRLYPRSLTGKPITSADKRAYSLAAEKEAYRPKPEEEIDVTFKKAR
jgi:YihY family inner membrane protein